MGASGLDIPEYKPLDFSAMADIPVLFQAARKAKTAEELARQNAATQKAYADNATKKLSNDEARRQWEQKRMETKDSEADALDAASQFNPGSDLMRAIASGNPAAAMIAKAHHANVTPPTTTVAPMPDANPATDTTSNEAQWLMNGGQPASGKDVLDETPDLYGPPDPNAGADTSADVPPDVSVDAELAKHPAPTVTTPWMADFKGQKFEIKPPAPAAPFGDPEYDGLYNRLIAQGDPAMKAEAKVLQMRGQNIGAAGRAGTLGEIKRHNLANEGLGGGRIEQSDTNSRRSFAASAGRDQAILGAAGIRANAGQIGGGENAPPIDPKALTAWRGVLQNGENMGAMKAAIQNRMNLERAAMELESGTPNAENQAMAIHTLGAISLSLGGQGGGRVTNRAIADVKEATGPYLAAKNAFYRATHGGENDPAIVATWQRAAQSLRELSKMHGERVLGSINQSAGTRSHFMNDPRLAPHVRDSMLGLANELGIDPATLDAQGTPDVPMAPAPQQPQAPHHPAQHAPMSDEQAVELAKARYAKNSNDAKAAFVLRAHGIIK